jgi:hypothetical protein
MSRLIDPTICPDCRGALDASATCTSCGLQVKGPLAAQLWEAMVTADGFIERLRLASAPTATPALETTPAAASTPSLGTATQAPGFTKPLYPRHPVGQDAGPTQSRTGFKLPSASVPVVLLALGGLCLLVAAIVFVAVTWSLLGLTGRTLVLLGFTSVLAAVAVVLTRAGLRGAAETFWLVVAGMLTVDLLAAQSAGLAGLDALSMRGTAALVGGALVAMGTGVGGWSRGQRLGQLYGVQVVAVIGGLVLCSANAWMAENPAVGTTIAIPLLAGGFVLLRRLVPWTAYGLGGLAGLSWLVLVGLGWDRALETVGLGDWWADFRGWPLLVAALFAAVVVHLPGVRDEARAIAAGSALVPLVLLANGPTSIGTSTRDLLTACATLVVLGLVTAFAPRAWAQGAAALTGLGTLLAGILLVVGPWPALLALGSGESVAVDPALATLSDTAAWTAVVVALTMVAAAASLLRHVPAPARREATQLVGTLAPAVVALGGLVLVLELDPPLWAAVLAAGLATAIAAGAAWWSRDAILAAVVGSCATAYLALVTLYGASSDDLLTALATTALFLGLVTAGALRELASNTQVSAGLATALGALVGGWALVAWGLVMESDTEARALVLAAYAGLVGILASPLTRRTSTRVALECSAALLAVVATSYSADLEVTAMTLTIVGTAICLIAVSTQDRTVFGWLGAVVLMTATLLRVIEDVRAPELYTLPAAALLIAVGAWRMRTDPEASSFRMLGSGLTLTLLPSLLLALDEPVSLRGALIGAGGVLVLGAGIAQRLAAPFVFGAITTGVLALRHLEPVADAVPRWITLGGVGLVLLLVGVTWEARRRNLDNARRYLTALR